MYDLERELIAELPARYETDTIIGNYAGVDQSNSADTSGRSTANANGGPTLGLVNVGNGNGGMAGAGHTVTQSNWAKVCQNFKVSVRL